MYDDGTYFANQLLSSLYGIWDMVRRSTVETFIIIGTISLLLGLVHLLLKDHPGILFIAAIILLLIAFFYMFSYISSVLNSFHY